MQNAVLRHFPNAEVVIRFNNRAPQMRFSRECFDWIQERVNRAYQLDSERVADDRPRDAPPDAGGEAAPGQDLPLLSGELP